MPELTKKHRTSYKELVEVSIFGKKTKQHFKVPLNSVNKWVRALKDEGVLSNISTKEDDSVTADEAFKDLYEKYTKPGVALRGARGKEGMTQKELAKKLGIPQGNLSQMENGKRPIGKAMAKRLARVLNIGYRVFL